MARYSIPVTSTALSRTQMGKPITLLPQLALYILLSLQFQDLNAADHQQPT